MITVLLAVALVIFAILIAIGQVKQYKYGCDADDIFCEILLSVIFGAGVVALFITDMVFIGKINTVNVVDSQIAVVQEENTELEEQICSAVENYLKYEGDIFQSLDITTAIGLYSAYPNLKSNELVQSLIETYQANTSEIKALKMKKTEISKYKWLVYFGH